MALDTIKVLEVLDGDFRIVKGGWVFDGKREYPVKDNEIATAATICRWVVNGVKVIDVNDERNAR